jgi:hypothetical protein
MIIWEKDPANYPEGKKLYRSSGMMCPNCGHTIVAGGSSELDNYLDDGAEAVVKDKIRKGCAIFYDIAYLGQFPEDETEHGDDESGWYSFQC